MNIRQISTEETEPFFQMLCRLDEETEYMLYEPGERKKQTLDLNSLKKRIESSNTGGDFLRVSVDKDGNITGFIWAERGKQNRVLHTAYIVIGILRDYRRKGLGTEFFRLLDDWAKANGIVRLELTVECPNSEAKSLYEKQGFQVEGIRPKAMYVNGRFIDEYYMGKILVDE